ncbi:MAG: hypothetical protein AAF288_01830 [Planctomycetota bacterium]
MHDPSEIDIDLPRGALSITYIYIWDIESEEYLWLIDLNAGLINSLRPGKLPGGVQSFPENGVPPELPENTDLAIKVTYKYDTIFPPAAMVGDRYWTFHLDGGIVSDQRLHKWLEEPDFPQGFNPHEPALFNPNVPTDK